MIRLSFSEVKIFTKLGFFIPAKRMLIYFIVVK